MWQGCWKNNTESAFGFAGLKTQLKLLAFFFFVWYKQSKWSEFCREDMKPRKDPKLMEKENLTLYGKINIVKTLGLAKLTYITSVIAIPDEIIKGIN